MDFLIFLLVGLFAGILAKAIMPGRANEPSGWIMTIVLGIVGAYVGGFAARAVGLMPGNFIGQILAATVGAIIIIAISRLFFGRRAV